MSGGDGFTARWSASAGNRAMEEMAIWIAAGARRWHTCRGLGKKPLSRLFSDGYQQVNTTVPPG
ncbi:MAG: hypothetical protein HXY34_03975 [Candidatus Thorarchaeota archaeon]|nr:hypothetical protein [Candidatus Thorarchaeota archaeon]